jgi:hypothetical protein
LNNVYLEILSNHWYILLDMKITFKILTALIVFYVIACGGGNKENQDSIIDGDAGKDTEMVCIGGICFDTKEAVDLPDIEVPDVLHEEQEKDAFDQFADQDTVIYCEETPKPELCPCKENSDCQSNFCEESFEGRKCAKLCPGSVQCPDNTTCTPVTIGGDTFYVCMFDFVHLCQPCLKNDDCAPDGKCVEFGSEGFFCGGVCSNNSDCPSGYSCVTKKDITGAELLQCVPDTGICKCYEPAIEKNLSTSCYVQNVVGKCYGTHYCEKKGLTGCNAPAPAPEICDNIDNDCNNITDDASENADGCKFCCKDNDNDSYCGTVDKKCLCKPEGAYSTLCKDCWDCDDTLPAVNPAAQEKCNGIDDNCDNITDDEGSVSCINFYYDNDEDGYGTCTLWKCLCSPKEKNSTTVCGDCDDANKDISPKAFESCATVDIDDNCNNKTDEDGAKDCVNYYKDMDDDGFGDQFNFKCKCKPDEAFVTDKDSDCNDSDKKINPEAPEGPVLDPSSCDGKDNNCNGTIDEGFPDLDNDKIADCVDTDCDGDGAGNSQDCKPCDKTKYKNAPEICNGYDDNCNGIADENCPPSQVVFSMPVIATSGIGITIDSTISAGQPGIAFEASGYEYEDAVLFGIYPQSLYKGPVPEPEQSITCCCAGMTCQ